MKNIVARATCDGLCYGDELVAIVRNKFVDQFVAECHPLKMGVFTITFLATDEETRKPDAGCFYFFDKYDLTSLTNIVRVCDIRPISNKE